MSCQVDVLKEPHRDSWFKPSELHSVSIGLNHGRTTLCSYLCPWVSSVRIGGLVWVGGSPYNRSLRPGVWVEVQRYPFITSALRWGWVASTTPRPLYPRKRPGTHCTGGWGRSRHPPSAGIRSPDRPARSESLYRLSYPGPIYADWGSALIRQWPLPPTSLTFHHSQIILSFDVVMSESVVKYSIIKNQTTFLSKRFPCFIPPLRKVQLNPCLL
jgi:hypothetical protein